MMVEYIEEVDIPLPEHLLDNLILAVNRVLSYEEIEKEGEVSVRCTDDATICRMNLQYRKINQPTDVLSFPQYNSKEDVLASREDYIILGDIMISVETAMRQAKEYGHSLQREMIYLTVHSMLHLLGYDHINPEDQRVMRKKEKEIMHSLEIYKRGKHE